MTYLDLDRLYDCEEIINSLKLTLSKLFDVDKLIYSNFYKLSANFFFRKNNHDEFYNNSIQYLAYVKDVSDLAESEKITLSYNMAVASLVGEKLFNFAELIEKDYFKSLQNSQYDWIYNLTLCFNSCKVDQFIKMMEQYKTQISTNETLKANIAFLQKKIKIAALLDLIFQRNKNERILSYKDVYTTCQCNPEEVELLVMKSLSLELIKGYIDEVIGMFKFQVEQKIVIDWIQPKYLDREKISMLKDRIDQWITNSTKVLINYEGDLHSLVG